MWSQKRNTHVHRNCESGLTIIYKHATHRLVQPMLQVMEMAWTDDSTLAIPICIALLREEVGVQ